MASLLSISTIERELLVNHDLVLRAITEADQSFLFQLYACTRKEELAIVPWSEEQKQTFLEFQFNAQHTFYQSQFKDAHFWVIESAGVSLGRLYLDQRTDEIRIIDIALMPAYRERGIGTTLLKAILAAGRTNKHPVTIHVERNNRALNLYRRLGFTQRGEESVYYLMEWAP
ncbi:GNAT family N-acetyltransferase [Acaryochloris marina NIES-2412]|uniref:GNAT family N-acetyltransferase n=1 Tax=Acaryochloris marina TaxID=155978 RepID=UPI004058325E